MAGVTWKMAVLVAVMVIFTILEFQLAEAQCKWIPEFSYSVIPFTDISENFQALSCFDQPRLNLTGRYVGSTKISHLVDTDLCGWHVRCCVVLQPAYVANSVPRMHIATPHSPGVLPTADADMDTRETASLELAIQGVRSQMNPFSITVPFHSCIIDLA